MSATYHRDVLPSGLRVVTVEAPHLHTALVAAYVRAGSRHENEANNGVSHFLEHMFFRGSRGYPDTVQMNAAVEEVGGNLNGLTARDHGYYYTPLHPSHLKVAVDILGDMLTRPLFSQMEVEREIILEEMLDEVDDKGRDIDLENLSKMELFAGHGLALKIAGTPDSVRSLRPDDLHTHHRRYYAAANMVFAAAGKVRREEVLEHVASAFAPLERGDISAERAPGPTRAGPWLKFVAHDDAQTEFRLSFRTVPEQHEDYPALQLLRRVLDDGLSSRLPLNVVERRGLAYSVHAGIEAFHDVGVFEVEAASAPGKAPAVVEEICRTLGELCERDIGEEELLRAKKRHRMFLEFAQDSAGELCGWFGGTELFRPPESLEERCQRVEAQTAAQVRQVARRYFCRGNLGAVAVGQSRGVKALEKAVAQAVGLP